MTTAEQPVTASPLLNRSTSEAAKQGASWSDFFDDTGKRRVKLLPAEELDLLTCAIGLLDDLDYLSRQVPQERSADVVKQLDTLRAEIGQAGATPDVNRALKAVETGTQRLRNDIRIYAPAYGAQPSSSAESYSYAARDSPRGRLLYFIFFLFLLVGLIVALTLTGHLEIIFIAGVVIAGIVAVILALWGTVKAAPFLKRRVFLPLVHGIALRFQLWRYALLYDALSVMIIAVLLLFGAIGVLVTVYAAQAAFGTWLDYAGLALAAAAANVGVTLVGLLAELFRSRISKS